MVATVEEIAPPHAQAARAGRVRPGLRQRREPGSGTSTTMATLIDYANEHRHDHIITILKSLNKVEFKAMLARGP